MNQLKEIIEQYKDKAAEAAIIPENSDPRTRAGVEALVRNAKQELPNIEGRYMDAVMGQVVLIAVTGENSEAFAKEAEKQGTVAVDFLDIYKKILSRLQSRAIGPVYTTDAHMKLLDELSKIRLEYNVVRLANPIISGYSDGIYEAPVAQALKALFEKNYGSDLYSAAARRDIGKKAFEKNFSGRLLPVVLYNYTGSVNATFLPTPVTVIVADKVMTDKQVKAALVKVKNALSGKNETSEQTESEDQTNSQTLTQEERGTNEQQ